MLHQQKLFHAFEIPLQQHGISQFWETELLYSCLIQYKLPFRVVKLFAQYHHYPRLYTVNIELLK